MEYHCGIIFLISIHLLSVLCVNGANVSAVEDCYWSGTGPICDGKCRLGEASEPNKNDRIGCITGKKKYCCKTSLMTNVTELAPPSTLQRDKETNTSTLSPLTKDDCYWVGKSPNCEGSCLDGDYMASTSRTGNGSTCIVGKKKYCCKGSMTLMNNSTTSTSANVSMATASKQKQTPLKITDNQCRWVGEPPLCLGSCKFGEYVAAKSPTGDGGAKCESGQKKYCCARGKPTADGQNGMAKKTVRESNQQSYNDVDPISNSSSRPPWLRPTPRDLPVNATGFKHRVNVVKIKRKLGLATTQSTLIPTSTTVPTTSPTVSTTSSTTETPTTTAASAATTATSLIASTTSSTTTASTTSAAPSTTSTTPSTTTSTPTTTASTTPSTTTASTTPSTTTASTTPSTTTTTTSTPTTTSIKVTKMFLSLPDILPVPFMFRSRPISNVAKGQSTTTSIVPLSTSLASIDKHNETFVLSTVGQPDESLQVHHN